MLGIRTPAKKGQESDKERRSPYGAEMAGPSPRNEIQRSVRRSIGEWETGAKESEPESEGKVLKILPAARTKQATAPSTSRSLIEKTDNPPEKVVEKYADRVTEARACLHKAKLHLNNSRNLKTDIKHEVIQRIDRLYQLVKEAEAERKIGAGNKKQDEQSKVEERSERQDESKKEAEDNLIKKIEQHCTILEENRKEMENLRSILKEQGSREEKITYANVAARKSSGIPSGYVATHSIAISSQDEKETGDQVLEKIRKVVNAREEGFKIDKVRKARDRRIIIGCSTREEIKKIQEKISINGSNLTVEEIKNKDPLVIIKDVMSYNTDGDIIRAIKQQNKKMLEGLVDEEQRMEVIYRKKTRNPLTSHVVLRVSSQVWGRMIERELIHVDLQRVRVTDQSPLIQCTKCLGYGHTKRLCSETADVCSHCGGLHLRAECTEWLSGETPSCVNCKKGKLDRSDHNAFSVDCPVRRKWDALARSSIAYC